MNIELETLPNCVTALRVELPPERVSQARQTILRDFQGAARLPGYRQGKAPRSLVETRYKKEIAAELERKLVADSTREAIAEKKLRVLSYGEVEKVELAPDSTLKFTAKLVTAPEFELPPYQSLPVKVPPEKVRDQDLDKAMEDLRVQFAEFVPIEGRGLALEDFAVIDFAGKVDGQPLLEAIPEAPKPLGGSDGFWIKLIPSAMLPGFAEALVGAWAGDVRDFSIEVPAEFPQAPMIAGKKIDYQATVRELKTQVLPALDDAFAEKLVPGKTLEELRVQVREDLDGRLTRRIAESIREQIVEQLISATEFDLPADFVRSETRRIMSDIVRQNQERGISDDEIRENTEGILTNANAAARSRLKSAFILVRIAEKEGIKVTPEELDERLDSLAARHGTTREKLRRQLEENDSMGSVREEALLGKTLAFLSANASVETIPYPTPGAADEAGA
jgi:trigger factor